MNMTDHLPEPNTSATTIEISVPAQLPSEPIVSVYMLTYNHERFIAQAIEGVIAQRCDFPIELIIGEDHSPDRTGSIVRDYQKKFPGLIRVLTARRNVGMNTNGDRCLKACRGKYVAICEGDDYWTDPNKLSTQVALLESSIDVSLVCHAVILFDDKKHQANHRVHRVAHRSRLILPSELVLGDGALIPTCSIVVRADVIRDCPKWWELCAVGDYPLVLRASQLGRVAYVDMVMGAYRINVQGSWSMRHIPDITHRARHAQQMKEMLVGFLRTSNIKLDREVEIVVSKYFFDAIVRTRGTLAERRELFRQHRSELLWADRWVAMLAIVSGQNLGWLRTPSKRVSAMLRRVRADMTQSRAERDNVAT